MEITIEKKVEVMYLQKENKKNQGNFFRWVTIAIDSIFPNCKELLKRMWNIGIENFRVGKNWYTKEIIVFIEISSDGFLHSSKDVFYWKQVLNKLNSSFLLFLWMSGKITPLEAEMKYGIRQEEHTMRSLFGNMRHITKT